MKSTRTGMGKLLASMFIFGSVGIFRSLTPLSSSLIAAARGLIGSLFLLGFLALRGQRFDRAAVRSRLVLLVLSGALIGLNWVLLFEAYRYTQVSTATMLYYMAPVIVMLLSPLLLKERLTARKLLCTAVALLGMVLVSGGAEKVSGSRGILLALGAAGMYAAVVILNKRITGVPAVEKTVVQLAAAALAAIPYTLLADGLPTEAAGLTAWLPVAVMGIVHTGLAYTLYFDSINTLPAQTAALLSYVDPVTALLLSAALLGEKMTLPALIGSVLVIAALVVSELDTNTIN